MTASSPVVEEVAEDTVLEVPEAQGTGEPTVVHPKEGKPQQGESASDDLEASVPSGMKSSSVDWQHSSALTGPVATKAPTPYQSKATFQC